MGKKVSPVMLYPKVLKAEMGKKSYSKINSRPLKNAQFCSSSRQAKILTAGIH